MQLFFNTNQNLEMSTFGIFNWLLYFYGMKTFTLSPYHQWSNSSQCILSKSYFDEAWHLYWGLFHFKDGKPLFKYCLQPTQPKHNQLTPTLYKWNSPHYQCFMFAISTSCQVADPLKVSSTTVSYWKNPVYQIRK